MSSMSSIHKLEDLPDTCLLDVLKKCEGEDLLRLQLASRRLCSLARAPVIWRHVIKRFFKLQLPKTCSYAWIRRIFRSLVETRGLPLGFINYWGMATDGGLDDDDPRHWVDNMFSGGAGMYYCSRMHQSSDIRCFAVHHSEVFKDRRLKSIIRVGNGMENQVPNGFKGGWGECQGCGSLMTNAGAPDDQLCCKEDLLVDEGSLGYVRDKARLSGPRVVLNRGVRIGRMRNLTCPVSSGVILLGNYDLATASGDNADLSRQLYALSQSTQCNKFRKFTDLEAVLSACKNKEVDLPQVVRFGTSGEWVEFNTSPTNILTGESLDTGGGIFASSQGSNELRAKKMQPVIWFRFYSKGEPVCAPARTQHISAEFAALGVKCEMVLEKVRPCLLPDSSNQIPDWLGMQPFPSSSVPSEVSTAAFDSGFESSVVDLSSFFHPSDQQPANPTMQGMEAQVDNLLGYMLSTSSSSSSYSSLSSSGKSEWEYVVDAIEAADGSAVMLGDNPFEVAGNSQVQSGNGEYDDMLDDSLHSIPDSVSGVTDTEPHNPMDDFLGEYAGAAGLGVVNGILTVNGTTVSDSVVMDIPDYYEWLEQHDADAQSTASGDLDFAYRLRIATPFGHYNYFSSRSMYDRELMDIEFVKPVVGNSVCVMLNNCENLMDEMNDMHEGPNVDVNFVWMMGETVPLG